MGVLRSYQHFRAHRAEDILTRQRTKLNCWLIQELSAVRVVGKTSDKRGSSELVRGRK